MNAKIHIILNKYLFTHIYNKIHVSQSSFNQTTKILLQKNETLFPCPFLVHNKMSIKKFSAYLKNYQRNKNLSFSSDFK